MIQIHKHRVSVTNMSKHRTLKTVIELCKLIGSSFVANLINRSCGDILQTYNVHVEHKT